MPHKPFKAVIPAAGLGTRFLPATKAMPKEMLPGRRQAGDPVRRRRGGAGRHRRHPRHHRPQQERDLEPLRLRARARGEAQGQGRRTTGCSGCMASSDLADIHFVRQGEPKGLGHAVLRARAHVGDSPVRRAARRRPHRRARPAADDDARRARPHRRGDHRAHGGRPRPHRHVRRGRGRGDRRPTDVVARHRSRREAQARGRAVEPRRDRPLRAEPRRSSTSSSAPSPARAARSSSPTRCRSSPPTPTAPACTASSSAVADTTPAIGWTTSRPSCSSPRIAMISAPSCDPGSRSSRRTL